MFLHRNRKDAGGAKLSEAILYLLWDIGFHVEHNVRSLSDCVSMARGDIVSRNSMIDARLLWSHAKSFEQPVERLDEEIFEKQKPGSSPNATRRSSARLTIFCCACATICIS